MAMQGQRRDAMALTRQGERAFEKMEKINAELFVVTYGSLVMQLLQDNSDNVDVVNKELDTIGYNIGVRLIDEYLSKSMTPCKSFKDTAEATAKVGFKMFLGVSAHVHNWSEDGKSYSLILEDNPLTTFAELPDRYSDLWYSNVLCGVIRGALEMVSWKVEVAFVKDQLKGADCTEIRVTLLKQVSEAFRQDDD
ncbi:Trafficking protein particle complex subunit 3 [Diplonema papillatum]|nr:Trafficking protein particle complex subunit 3 [Diplonema papillatum]